MYSLYFDGKAEPNPGKGSGAAVLYFEDKIIFEIGKYLEHTTNNQAEYLGLIICLKECIKRNIKEIQVFGDSNLIIEQSAGRWKVKNEGLIELNSQVKTFIKHFTSISFTHVYRDKNTKADELTNIVYDSKKNLNYEEENIVVKQKTINEMFKVVEEKSEMKEVIDLMKEIRDLLKKFVESVEVQ
jgi:ribonuclease HI